jgi:cytochrome c
VNGAGPGHDGSRHDAAIGSRREHTLAPARGPARHYGLTEMLRNTRFHINLVILVALAACIPMHALFAGGATLAAVSVSEGHRLAEAWCESCHAIEPHMAGMSNQAPSFEAIANRHGTTALSLKVFLKTSHQNMPNLVIAPDQADALASYILSLKAN